MANKSRAKNNVIARIQALINGLKQNQSGQTLVLNGVSISQVALIAALEAYIAQLNATTTAHAAWLAAVQETKTMEDGQVNPQIEALEHYLEGIYGSTSSTLADYGLKPA